MKTIIRRICGVLLGLGVLGMTAPLVRADEMADWMAEQRRQNDEYHRQWQQWWEESARAAREAAEAQAARDRAYYEAQQEQAARDKAYQEAEYARAEQARAQAEQDAWYKSQQEQQQWYEDQKRQQEWNDWWNNQGGGWYGGSADNSADTGQVWFRGHAAPQSQVILNPFIVEKMTPEDQEKLRQRSKEMGQQITEGPVLIQNPFVKSPK
jgi:flagellar biosynthesis GTPase FlhF